MTEQETAFWKTIAVFEELGILKNIVAIGDWAEYLFASLFKTGYIPNTPSRNAEFLYKYINKPKQKINLIEELKRRGYAYCEQNGISTFYSGMGLQIQFTTCLTELKKQKENSVQEIPSLGIIASQNRNVNILAEHTFTIEQSGFTIKIPEPACYAIQKVISNQTDKIRILLLHIKNDEHHFKRFTEIYNALPVKQQRIFNTLPIKPTPLSSNVCSSSGKA